MLKVGVKTRNSSFKKKTSFIIVFSYFFSCFIFLLLVFVLYLTSVATLHVFFSILSLIFLHYLRHPHHHHQYGRFALKIVSWIYYLIEDVLIYLSCCLLVGLDWIEMFEAMVLYLQYCCMMMMMLIIKMTN